MEVGDHGDGPIRSPALEATLGYGGEERVGLVLRPRRHVVVVVVKATVLSHLPRGSVERVR